MNKIHISDFLDKTADATVDRKNIASLGVLEAGKSYLSALARARELWDAKLHERPKQGTEDCRKDVNYLLGVVEGLDIALGLPDAAQMKDAEPE